MNHYEQYSSSQQQQLNPTYQNDIQMQRFISPPNPITTKTFYNDDDQLSILQKRKRNNELFKIRNRRKFKQGEQLTLQNFYSKDQLIFQKYDNYKKNIRSGIKYASSVFSQNIDQLIQSTKYIGMIADKEQYIFDSNYQSANLFQVYQTGYREYDLVLQNDINTTGYSQWFNFKIRNHKQTQMIKINIVNFYKSTSLYQKGMKPLCMSKLDEKKWQRNTFQVQYYQNQIPMQRNPNKNYHTLSFCYEFKHQFDEVQFSHFYPYTSLDCQNFLSQINGSKKIKIKNIGNSSFKKTIPLIHIFSAINHQKSNQIKKAIIFIGRQHSGQTQSSFLIQEIVNILLGSDNQAQFILQKFDVYICPMLNIDGISLGNYRTNAFGLDLNRYWNSQSSLKTPEIFYFKKFVSSLKKRQNISLILDLHGHSKKLNSFFFGNPFGKNYMILPYVASKISQMIKFKSCTFNEQKSQKSKTARAVLGSILKDSTYFYTFEVSFWGFKKNNRVIPFTMQTLKQLSRALISTIYKVFMQEIKEEITMKESVFFKEIKRQLSGLNENFFEKDSGSDSQAEQLTIKQKYQRQTQNIQPKHVKSKISNQHSQYRSKQIGIQVNMQKEDKSLNQTQVLIYSNSTQGQNINNKKFQNPFYSNNLSKPKISISNSQRKVRVNQNFTQFKNEYSPRITMNKFQKDNKSLRKQYLLQKLRIFGQTCQDNFQFQSRHSNGGRNVCIQVPQQMKYQSTKVNKKHNSMNQEKPNLNLHFGQNLQKRNVFVQKSKKKNKSFMRNKNYSLMLTKAQVQCIQYSKKQTDRIRQLKHNEIEKQFFIKISKQPLIRIEKYSYSLTNQLKLDKINQGQISQNMSHLNLNINLKRNTRSLRGKYKQKLPEIEMLRDKKTLL